jgi:hypothetical protein
VSGKWTLVYAQSLMVELNNGLRFVTNMRFYTRPDISPDPLDEFYPLKKFENLDNHDSMSFNTDCGATMIGIVKNIST